MRTTGKGISSAGEILRLIFHYLEMWTRDDISRTKKVPAFLVWVSKHLAWFQAVVTHADRPFLALG